MVFSRTPLRRNLGRGDAYVKQVFDTVASRYDLMNDVLSLGVHRAWKQYYVHNIVQPRPGQQFLDVAGGTGDIAFKICDVIREKQEAIRSGAVPFTAAAGSSSSSSTSAPGTGIAGTTSQITILDINDAMLEEGKGRAMRNNYSRGFSWVTASSEELPFPDNQFDTYTVSFGIRNFDNRPKALREALRVLKVGGALHVLEFSRVDCSLLEMPYKLWGDIVIPAAGRALSDEASYQYLVDSIRAFPPQEEFAAMIREAGFGYARYENLTGGIAAIHSGIKTAPIADTPAASSGSASSAAASAEEQGGEPATASS